VHKIHCFVTHCNGSVNLLALYHVWLLIPRILTVLLNRLTQYTVCCQINTVDKLRLQVLTVHVSGVLLTQCLKLAKPCGGSVGLPFAAVVLSNSLRQLTVVQLVNKLPPFVEPECSLPCSQNSLLDPTLSQMNPVHILIHCFFKISFNIILAF
jgi:hypothetical protein